MFVCGEHPTSLLITVDSKSLSSVFHFAQQVQRILNDIDLDGNSKIDYEEFLAATMHLNKLSREENMIAAFEYFDKGEN